MYIGWRIPGVYIGWRIPGCIYLRVYQGGYLGGIPQGVPGGYLGGIPGYIPPRYPTMLPGYLPPYTPWVYHCTPSSRVHEQQRGATVCVPGEEALGSERRILMAMKRIEASSLPKV